jgi:hypothetical protein
MSKISTGRFGEPTDPQARTMYWNLRSRFEEVATDLGVEDIRGEEFSQYAGDNQEEWTVPGAPKELVAGVFLLVTGREL